MVILVIAIAYPYNFCDKSVNKFFIVVDVIISLIYIIDFFLFQMIILKKV